MAERSKAWGCGRFFVEIVGSNPGGGMDVYLLRVLFVVRYRFLCQADHLSRAALLSVVCLSVIVMPQQ